LIDAIVIIMDDDGVNSHGLMDWWIARNQTRRESRWSCRWS